MNEYNKVWLVGRPQVVLLFSMDVVSLLIPDQDLWKICIAASQ